MMQCWCHAVMSGWLGGALPDAKAASAGVMARWRAECERDGAHCGDRVEAMALRLSQGRAVRKGLRLSILAQARTVEFVDDSVLGLFRYLGWHEACGAHLVLHQVGDVDRFRLVSHVTAGQTVHADIASLPDGAPRWQAPSTSGFQSKGQA